MAEIQEIELRNRASVPWLPPEIWAIVCENLPNIQNVLERRKSIMSFRQLSKCHLSLSWPVFGRAFFFHRRIIYCPHCPVKRITSSEFDHPILSRYIEFVTISLKDCRISKRGKDVLYRGICCAYNSTRCPCAVVHPSLVSYTALEDSKMSPLEVIQQVESILGLQSLKHLKFEADDFVRQRHPKLIQDIITSFTIRKTLTGHRDGVTLIFLLEGKVPMPVPQLALPSDQVSHISKLTLRLNDIMQWSTDAFFLELIVACPNLLTLRLHLAHELPSSFDMDGYDSLQGQQKSLRMLEILSDCGLSILSPTELLLMIGLFPNLTGLCLDAPVRWCHRDWSPWVETFQEAVRISKLSAVYVDIDSLYCNELYTENLGDDWEFPSKRDFASWGITPYEWVSRGKLPSREFVDDEGYFTPSFNDEEGNMASSFYD